MLCRMQTTYLLIRKFVVYSRQLVYFSISKPVPKNLQTPFYALSNRTGNLANCPPSPFGEGRGEAVRGCISGFLKYSYKLHITIVRKSTHYR